SPARAARCRSSGRSATSRRSAGRPRRKRGTPRRYGGASSGHLQGAGVDPQVEDQVAVAHAVGVVVEDGTAGVVDAVPGGTEDVRIADVHLRVYHHVDVAGHGHVQVAHPDPGGDVLVHAVEGELGEVEVGVAGAVVVGVGQLGERGRRPADVTGRAVEGADVADRA